MTAENAKQKTNSQLQNSFKNIEILRSSVTGYPFSALRFLQSWDFTLIHWMHNQCKVVCPIEG